MTDHIAHFALVSHGIFGSPSAYSMPLIAPTSVPRSMVNTIDTMDIGMIMGKKIALSINTVAALPLSLNTR